MKKEIIIKISLKILVAILLLLSLLKMPFGYFQLVRFFAMACFIWFAYVDSKKSSKTLVIIWVMSALLFNPFIKVALGRDIWNIVDVIWGLILIASIWEDKKALSVSNHS